MNRWSAAALLLVILTALGSQPPVSSPLETAQRKNMCYKILGSRPQQETNTFQRWHPLDIPDNWLEERKKAATSQSEKKNEN